MMEKKNLRYNIKDWKPIDRAHYMSKLTRNQVSILFKARTRMLDVKNNFRNKYRDEVCRGCGTTTETQKHVMEECPILHPDEQNRTNETELFSGDLEVLRKAPEKINNLMDMINQCTAPQRGELLTEVS